MGNNIKRAIKARMRKHGETHSTARRYVLAAKTSNGGSMYLFEFDHLSVSDEVAVSHNGRQVATLLFDGEVMNDFRGHVPESVLTRVHLGNHLLEMFETGETKVPE